MKTNSSICLPKNIEDKSDQCKEVGKIESLNVKVIKTKIKGQKTKRQIRK